MTDFTDPILREWAGGCATSTLTWLTSWLETWLIGKRDHDAVEVLLAAVTHESTMFADGHWRGGRAAELQAITVDANRLADLIRAALKRVPQVPIEPAKPEGQP